MRKCIGILKISVIRKTIHRFLLKTYSLESLIEPAAWTTMGGGGSGLSFEKSTSLNTPRKKKHFHCCHLKASFDQYPTVGI